MHTQLLEGFTGALLDCRGAILTCSVLSRPLACELSPRDERDRWTCHPLCPGSTVDVPCGLFTVVTWDICKDGLLLQSLHRSSPDSTALLCWEDPAQSTPPEAAQKAIATSAL